MHLRLTHRTGRLLVAAIACVTLAVPAVALASSGARSIAATPRCNAASTEVWLGLNQHGATAGQTYYPLEFTNISHQTCTLYGYPRVLAIGSSNQQLGPPAAHAGTRHTVTLKPGQTAHALLAIADPNAAGCPSKTAAGLEVSPAGQVVKQHIGSFTFLACSNSTVFMNSGPVQAGVGIP